MIGDILQPTHLLFILLVALLVLGPKRLPEVGRSLGRGLRDFRGAMAGIEEHTTGMFDEPSAAPNEGQALASAPAAAPVMATQTFEPVPQFDSSEPGEEPDSEDAFAEPAPIAFRPLAVSQSVSRHMATGGYEPDPSEYSD